MAITYVNGDISTSDNVDSVTGLSFTGLGHAAADWTLGIWALIIDPTPTLDARFTEIDNDTDQNLRAILFERDAATMTGSESGTISMTTVGTNQVNRMSAAFGIWRGVGSRGTPVNFTEGGTADDVHPVANNLSITPTADNALIVLVYAERSSTGNTAGTLAPPTHVGTGTPATIRRERGTGGTGGTYVQIAEFQLGAGTAGVAQTFTQWNATPDTLIASNAEMWLIPLYPAGESHAGAVALSGVGTLAPAGTPAIPGSVGLSGVGSFAASGMPATSGSVGLSGAGSQAEGGIPTLLGAAELAGDGSLSSAGQPTLPGDLPLFGGGSLGVNGTSSTTGELPLTGDGDFASSGAPSFMVELALAGEGFLALAAEAPLSHPGHLVATATQSLTARDSHSTLTATTQPASRLEASDGV